MKHFTIALLAGATTIGFMSSAMAADLIVQQAPAAAGVVDVGGNWDGPYIGVFAGAGFGLADHTSQVPGNDLDLSGWKVGVAVGANFTLSGNVVAGVVGDLAWADISGSDDTLFGDPTHTINWEGSLRGRLGFDGGDFLPYVTAGLAFANATRTSTAGGPDNHADQTHIGWTAGVGVEFAVADNLSVDLQYRYTDLGEQVYDWSGGGINPTIDLHTHAVTAGLNWRF